MLAAWLQRHDLLIANMASCVFDTVTLVALGLHLLRFRPQLAVYRITLWFVFIGCLVHIPLTFMRGLGWMVPPEIVQSWVLKDLALTMLIVILYRFRGRLR